MARSQVTIEGLDEALDLLDKYRDPELKKLMSKALKGGAGEIRKPIRDEAPVDTGDLRKTVGVRKSRRLKDAYIVGPKSPISHLVIGGTKPHRIRARHVGGFLFFGGRWIPGVDHPGTSPNSFVERGERAGRAAAEHKIVAVLREPLKGR